MNKLKAKVTTKTVEFDGDKVDIVKLSMKGMKKVRKAIAELDKDSEDFQMHSVYVILRVGVIGCEDFTDDDFEDFNPADLAKLANEVMSFSGIELENVPEGEIEGN